MRFFDDRGTMGTNKRTMEKSRIIITKMRRPDQDSIILLTLLFSNDSRSANGTIPTLSLSPFSCPKMWTIRLCIAMSENFPLSQRCLLRAIQKLIFFVPKNPFPYQSSANLEYAQPKEFFVIEKNSVLKI